MKKMFCQDASLLRRVLLFQILPMTYVTNQELERKDFDVLQNGTIYEDKSSKQFFAGQVAEWQQVKKVMNRGVSRKGIMKFWTSHGFHVQVTHFMR